MGIIDEYLSKPKAVEAPTAPVSSSGLLNQYMSAPRPTRVIIDTTPKPPISGVSAEESAAINAEKGIQGGENPRAGIVEGIKNLPANLASSIKEEFQSGTKEIGQGVSEIASGKPASGVGNIGLGALRAAVSPISGAATELVEKPITEITGNPDIGKRVSIVTTSGLPIVKAGKVAVQQLPKNRALKTLVESIGPENLPSVVRAMKENDRLSPADLSAKVKQDTQNLFTIDGPHINYLDDVVKNRTGGAKEAVESAMDEHLGQTVDAVTKLNELKQNIRNVGRNEINPSVEMASPVNIKPVIDYIDSRLKPGVKSVISSGGLPDTDINAQLGTIRKILTDDKSMRISAHELHDIQYVLRAEAEGLLNSSSGHDRRMGRAIMDVRNHVVNAIDTASPQVNGKGSYKPALSKYRDEFQIEKAFNHGHDAIITNSKAIQNRPEFFKEWIDKASPEELHAAREGARVAIDTTINGFKHAARRGTDVGEVGFNRERIEALFGKDEADKLFKKLQDERTIADTNNKLVQGSQTAMRSASKAAFALPTPSQAAANLLPPAVLEGANILAGGPGGLASASYAGLKGVGKVKDAIAMKLAREHNARYARYALPEGEDRAALIQTLDAIANRPPKQSLLRRGATALSRVVSP